MKKYFIKTVIVGVFIGLLCNSISAQNFLFQTMPKNQSQFGLKFMRPNFEWDIDLSLLSGTYDFYLNIPVSSKLNFVGILPFTTFSTKEKEKESGIGNIYVGFQTRPVSELGSKSSIALGVFLPSATDEPSPIFLGIYSNYSEFQKYVSDILTVYGNYSYFISQFRGVRFGLEIGPCLFFPTKEHREGELFAHYGVSTGFKITNVTFNAELVGLAIISESEEDIDFKDRFIHSLAFGAQWTGGNIRPAIFYAIYLKEELSDVVDGVLGIKFDFLLP